VTRNGELIGLLASRAKGDRQWLLCDLLAQDDGDALRACLAAGCNLANARSDGDASSSVRKVAVLLTPPMADVARDLGFQRDEYNFPLVVHPLDPEIRGETVDPSRWYISAND
jgi:hypothetical protein